MASLKQASKPLEDVICSICMEILQNPVTIDCGHNFCLQCINQVGKTAENLQCPLCKLPVNKNMLRPSELLASPAEFQPEEEPRCQKHKEKYNYVCENDKNFLCLVCRDSRDHKTHQVTLIDEAAQNYKGINDILNRDKEFEFHNPTPVPMDLEKKISEAKARHEPIIESLKELPDNLNTEGKEDKSTFLKIMNIKDIKNRRLLQKNNSELPTSEPSSGDGWR